MDLHTSNQTPGSRPSPTALVQNPALGAAALWSAASGHAGGHNTPLSLHAAFLILPIVLDERLRDLVNRTQVGKGLAKFVGKFQNRESELLAIAPRAVRLRALTLESLGLAVAGQLLTVDYGAGTVSAKRATSPTAAPSTKAVLDAAEKLGHWFGRIELANAAFLLRVDF